MKKIIIIVVFGLVAISSFAQECFPTDSAIWNVTVSGSNCLSGYEGPKRNFYYTICGDTTINDTLYYKLYTSLDTTICGNNLQDFLGIYRLDEQKVWFKLYHKAYSIYPAYFYPECLLYDFGATIGDTIWYFGKIIYSYENNSHNIFDEFGGYHIVTNVEIENGVKKITVNGVPFGWDIWYEGIGSIYGFFFPINNIMIGEWEVGMNLNCVKHNDTIIYLNNIECNKCFCSSFISADAIQHNSEIIKIYPNPTKSTLYVESKGTIKNIEIINELGNIVLQQKNNSNNIEINITSFKPSNYIVKVAVNDDVIKYKFIKE